MLRLLALPLLLAALVPTAGAKGPLSLSGLASLGRYIDCSEQCVPLPAQPTYDQHLQRQQCLALCGEPPRTWEKDGVAPVDRRDLDLAFLEYQHHTPGNATPHICYADAAQTIVVPAALCTTAVCQQVASCTSQECALPAQNQPICSNVGGTYACMWPAGKRPARCPDVVCSLAPTRTAASCADADGDRIPKWLDDGLQSTAGGTNGDASTDTLCSTDKPCAFNSVCRVDGSRPGGVCKPRTCPQTGCTAFHLETVAQDDTQATVHVYYDWSPIPARVLDLPVVYDQKSLELVDARLLPTVTLYKKTLATQHLSDGTLRLSIYDAGSSEPIPFGPIIELVFARIGDGATTVAFSKVDALQQAALAPLQGSPTGPQQELTNDALWGAPVALAARADVPLKLRYWVSFDDVKNPFSYRNVPSAEELCARWPACRNEQNPAIAARTLDQLDALQAGQFTASRTISGVSGAAAVMNGDQDHLRLPVHFAPPLVADTQHLGMSTWFFAEPKGPTVLFSHNGYNERTAVVLLVEPQGTGVDVVLQAGDALSPPGLLRTQVVTGIAPRSWHHVAMSLDAASGKATVWFDGAARQPIQLPPAAGPDFIKCPQLPNTIDVVQGYEGGTKGSLSGSTPPEQIWFGSVDGVRPTIQRMSAVGLERKTVLTSDEAGFRDVDYSPAVDRLVYASDSSGGWEIWLSRPDGTDARQITVGFGDTKHGTRARRPRWSPDGSTIIFESNAWDMMAQDNTYRRIYHLYVLRYDREEDAIAATLPDGTQLTKLDYDARVNDGTIRVFRVTEASVDQNYTNAHWLQSPTSTTGGTLVADRATDDFTSHEVVRIALAQPLASSAITPLSGLSSGGQTSPRLLAARRYAGFSSTGVPTAQEFVFYEVTTTAGPSQFFAEVSSPTAARTPLTQAAAYGTFEDAALAPTLDVSTGLPQVAFAVLPPTGRPALLRTQTPGTAQGATALTEATSRVRGLSWVRQPRLYPCQWVAGFQHPTTKAMTLGFRGALDDLRVYSGLLDADAVRSEFERGLAVLERDGRTGSQPTLFDPVCTGHSDCVPGEVCVRPVAGAAGTCQVVPCNPQLTSAGAPQTVCPSGGRCWPQPPGFASPTLHVCVADCDSDDQCYNQQCATGICRFCNAGVCSECRTLTDPTGPAAEGCPDEKSFACNALGACVTSCYAFEDGNARYLCDPATRYCQGGQCVAHTWSWWDLAPAGFGGLGEARRDIPPTPQLFEKYRIAADQRAIVKLTAYGVEDLEEEPEVLIEAKGGIFYGSTWKEIGRVTVVARTPGEATQRPLIVSAWPFESLRLRLVVPPYGNPSAGVTGFDAGKDQPFCPTDALAPNAPASGAAACKTRPPGSAAHLGYGPVPRWLGIGECNARDRSGCPGYDVKNAYPFLRGGYPAAAVLDLEVNGNRVTPTTNHICSYKGTRVPTEANGLPRRLWFGGNSALPEQSAAARVACPTGSCGPAAGGAQGLLTFDFAQAGFALLNCPWNAPNTTPAAITYNGPILFNSDVTLPIGDIVRDDGEICTVEAGASLAPCYALAGQDASCDAGNTAIDFGVSTPMNTLDFATFRYFGHEQGFTAVPLPRANLSVTVTGLAGSTLDVRVGSTTLTFTGPGTKVAANLKQGARFTALIVKQPALPNHRCFVEGAAFGNMTPAGATITIGCQTVRTVGGQAQGLSSGRLVLRLDHSGVVAPDFDEVDLAGQATQPIAFKFGSGLPTGQKYSVSVARQPEGLSCAVSGAKSGTIASADVTGVVVSCAPVTTQAIGVKVTGLLGGGLRIVDRATSAYLTVTANGVTSFPKKRNPGYTYELFIVENPASPAQVCTLGAGAIGTVGQQPVEVGVSCTTLPTFPVVGVAYGVIGTGLSLGLKVNGASVGTELLTPTNPPGGVLPVSFSAPVAPGQSYLVEILSQPLAPEQTCAITAGSGTVIDTAPVAFAVTCVPKTSNESYTIGGAVAGLQGTGLRLTLSGGVQKLDLATNGVFTFPTPLLDGDEYEVTVTRQPTAPTQGCSVVNGKGVVKGTNVTSVAVECVDAGLVAVTLTNLASLEGAGVKGFLYTLQAPVRLVAIAPSGITISDGQASFNMKLHEATQPAQPQPDALLPAGAYGLVLLVNADGSTDTSTGQPLFNPGDKGAFAQIAVAVRQVNTVTLAGTKDLQKGRVVPQSVPPGPITGRVTCYWAPAGQKAVPLPPNPKVLPILATTTQCPTEPCASDDPLKKLKDEGVLLGAPGLAFDVTCWHDLDASGSLTAGDTYGTKLGVSATSPVLVLDQTK